MIIVLPVLVMLLGLVLYLVSAGRPNELGRLMFFAGLLVALLLVGQGHGVKLW